MWEQWMATIELPLSIEQFRQLPRNPAYKYEYLGGKAYLSPRARHFHAVLDLQRSPIPDDVEVQPAKPEELLELAPLFCGAFRSIQPYGSLDDETREQAARHALERTRNGGERPLIEHATVIAVG